MCFGSAMHRNDETPPAPPEARYIGSTEACTRLRIDRATLTRWIQSGSITPAGKLEGPNGAYLWDPEYINRLVIDRANAAHQAAS